MRYFSAFLLALVLAGSAQASAPDGTVLDYTLRVRLRDGETPLERRIQLVTTPPVATRNRVKKPRFVGWRLRVLPGPGQAVPAFVLTRVAGLFYLEAPAAGIVPTGGGMRMGNRFCRLWQAQTPGTVGAFVYLVEVAPDLLALSYLSASLPEGEIASLEIHLEEVSLARVPSPAEEGRVLLRTLHTWAVQADASQQVMTTEQIN